MGSAGSGNFGHAGRPGERGGSTPGVGDRVYYRHQGVTKVGRITDTQGQVGSRGLKITNDQNREIHTVPESNLVGKSATSAAIWNKEHTGMRVNPGTKAPGAKAAAAAGRAKVGINMEEATTPEGHKILYLYGTPVAAKLADGTVIQTSKKWSTTTSSHIRKWGAGGGDKYDQQFLNDLAVGKHSPKMSPSETVRANIDAASKKPGHYGNNTGNEAPVEPGSKEFAKRFNSIKGGPKFRAAKRK